MKTTMRTLLAASCLLVAQSASAARAPVPVLNYTNTTGIGEYVSEHAPAPIMAFFAPSEHLALFVRTSGATFDKVNVCVALVGITQDNSKLPGQMPRLPPTLFRAAATSDATDSCDASAIRAALDELFAADVKDIRSRLSLVRDSARGTRTKIDGGHFITYVGMSEKGADYLLDLYPKWLKSALNTLNYQSVALNSTIPVKDGGAVCSVMHGFTARPAVGQNPRFPAHVSGYIKYFPASRAEAAKRDDVCFDPLWEQLISDLQPDEERLTGLVKDWAKVAEPGVPAPSMKQIEAAYRKVTQPQATVARTNAVNRTSCTNDCVNGSCVRTFPDGRKERWQAPRRYNALTNNWEWDTMSNACGL